MRSGGMIVAHQPLKPSLFDRPQLQVHELCQRAGIRGCKCTPDDERTVIDAQRLGVPSSSVRTYFRYHVANGGYDRCDSHCV